MTDTRENRPAGPSLLARLGGADAHIPVAVFVLGLLFTLLVTQVVREVLASRDIQRFREVVGIAHTTIEAKMATIIAVLRAGVGLYNAVGSVDRDQFRRFADELGLETTYRGVLGYGFVERVEPARIEAFLAARRAEGEPAFRIETEGTSGTRYVVTYIEPDSEPNRAILGFDIGSNPERLATMEWARDSASPAASGRLDLMPDHSIGPRSEFLIYAPVYRGIGTPASLEERRRLLEGFVFSRFDTKDLLESTLTAGLRTQISFKVFEGPPVVANLLYGSQPADGEDAAGHDYAEMRALSFAGVTWTIDYHSRPGFDASSPADLARVLPTAGAILSLLFATIAFAQVRSRRAAIEEAAMRRRAQAAVAERETRLRRIIDNMYALVVVLDPEGKAVEVNSAPFGVLKVERREVLGRPFWELPWWAGSPGRQSQIERAVKRAAAGSVVREDVEIGAAESASVLDMQFAPVRDDTARVRFVVLFAVDVTDRKRSEEHRQTLLSELNHRVKNTLAITQSLARQTGARSTSVEEFLPAFQGRLMALAAANDLLTQSGWRTARLDQIVAMALRPHLVQPDGQLKADVPAAELPTELAQDLVLIFHELATNAQKYGALSSEDGVVAITGTIDETALHLLWSERGGPAVRPPESQGFGSTLLEALVHTRHRGEVEFAWDASGMSCSIRIPREQLAEQS
ncbi:CHASE domain-containing protein [Propylenella binzhouense]|uniref:Blue-light-activated histidine kinase n=1 Tax=Propylenella binzhouense TaxID=2555902 RepID=A0A964T3X4_9HYPH|nr:CHASE domain-containing protein [Propylenella binzhouense]MYZ48031.1 PAS domain S-box protein [Propylenella binzhouense]